MVKTVRATDTGAEDLSEAVRNLLHDLQNHLHLATMEVELAQLDASEKVDCVKLLQILSAFKGSLQELRERLLLSN
jgi:hypothetical protein